MRGIWKSITFKWMAFSVFLATIPLVIAGINIFQVYQKDLRESIIVLQKEKASRIVEKTRGFLERATDNLQLIAGDQHFLKVAPSHTKDHLNHYLSQVDFLMELIFLNEKGFEQVKVSKLKTEKKVHPEDQSMSPIFQTASRGEVYYGNFHYTSDGKPSMAIAVPTGKYEGRPVGVLIAKVYLEPLTDLLHRTKIGEMGSAYVMDKEGYLIAHPTEKNILLGPFVDQVIAGQEGSLEFENLRKQKFLVVYKPIPELKWGVIVQVPVEEAYIPLQEITQTAIKWTIIAFILAFAFSFFLTKRFTSPIKQLSGEMARVSKGDLDVHIEPSTRDEVGQLTQSFNQMIQDLKQSQEAIKEAEEKYRKVFENSKDMVFITSVDGKFIDVNQAGVEMLGYDHQEELMKTHVLDCYLNPEERSKFKEEVAQKGFAKDFEIKLKKKDGIPLDCLITATARRDGEGHIIGYEGTIKDISDRKRMEDELYQRTKELETLYDLSFLINQTLNLDQVLPMALERVLDLTGFEMGTIYLVSDDRKWLELKYHRNYPSHLEEAVKRLKRGEGVAGSVVDKKEMVIFSIDQYPSPRILPNLIEEKVKTLVGIPLLAKEEAVGAICLTSRSDRLIKQDEIHLLESLGNQIGMAIENARLFSSVAKAKAEWETTFDTVADLITVRDKDYRILRANKAAFIRWGMGPERMIGEKCYEILHNFSSPCEDCYVTEAFRTGRPASGERESEYLNGIFQYYTYPIHDESGEIVAVVDMAREITEEKRMEREKEVINNINKILASSLDMRQVTKVIHSEFKKVLSSDRMTITLLDETGRRFRYFALVKDYAHEELTKDRTYPIKGTPFDQAVQTGQPVIVEDLFVSEVWLDQRLFQEGIRSSLVFPLESQGKIIGTLNFDSKEVNRFSEKDFHLVQQISSGLAISIQNALLLQEMKQSEEQYRTVVEGAHDGICVIGKDNRIKFVNKRLTEIQDYPQEELIGKDFNELVDEESRRLMTDRFTRRERGEKLPPGFELKAVRKDGEIRNIEINAKVIKDSQGEINYIVFLKDITEKKKMEEQLLQTEKLRSLGEMASGVAHDFNNALAAILGNTQLLLYTAQDDETREALKTIEKVAKESAQTVKRLQEFTRKKARQELFKLDVNSIVRDAIEITKPKWRDNAQGKGIHIEILSSLGEVPGVAGDASELREVLTNLIFNAVEAMPQGGTIEFKTFRRGGDVHIRIADTGIGMDEETRKKIFEPFFTTKPFSNTGLGLSMSYGIIKRFGGRIEVESKAGSGTAFTIILPVAIEGKEAVSPQAMIKPVRPVRILVIDDEETVREVLEKMLSRVNHRVTLANNGEEGIRLFQEKEFDMVLTDLGMPGMSGWEVCGRIKKANPSTPVGMITGWGMEIDPRRKEEAGLDFIITKPFDFNQIVSVVSEQIESNIS